MRRRLRVHPARNGDILRGAFVIDRPDREILARHAVANAGMGGSDVRDMMRETVEARFRGHRAPHRVEMLGDNGAPCIAGDTRIFARQLGPKPCCTPVETRKSDMGKAVAYILTRWNGLALFAKHGRVEMDSNLVENQIRPLALNRKDALFSGHNEGAQNWARIASLVTTCKMNGVEPFAYLKATLEAIAAGHSKAHIDDLLTWALPKTAVKAATQTAIDRAALAEAMEVKRRLL